MKVPWTKQWQYPTISAVSLKSHLYFVHTFLCPSASCSLLDLHIQRNLVSLTIITCSTVRLLLTTLDSPLGYILKWSLVGRWHIDYGFHYPAIIVAFEFEYIGKLFVKPSGMNCKHTCIWPHMQTILGPKLNIESSVKGVLIYSNWFHSNADHCIQPT